MENKELGKVFTDSLLEDSESDELYHYGIKGMKWGVRRTAAQLGHVTAKGAKKVGSAVSSAYKQRREKKRVQKLMSKSVRSLSSEEYAERMDRLSKEKSMLDLQRNVNQLDQKAVSAGKKFLQDVIVPAAMSAAKNQITTLLNDKFGQMLGLDSKALLTAVKEGKKTLDDLTDSEIKRMSTRGEGTDSIAKKLFGKKDDNNDEDGGIDGTQLLKDYASGKRSRDSFSDKEWKVMSKASDRVQNSDKAVNKFSKGDNSNNTGDDSSSTNSSSTKSESDSKPKADTNSAKNTSSGRNSKDLDSKPLKDWTDDEVSARIKREENEEKLRKYVTYSTPTDKSTSEEQRKRGKEAIDEILWDD